MNSLLKAAACEAEMVDIRDDYGGVANPADQNGY